MEDSPRRGHRLLGAFAAAAIPLWVPCLLAASLDARVRRSFHDAYFWPGLVPGGYLTDHHYDESFVWFTLASLAGWTWVAAKRRWLGVLGAGLQGVTSTGYLMAIVSM